MTEEEAYKLGQFRFNGCKFYSSIIVNSTEFQDFELKQYFKWNKSSFSFKDGRDELCGTLKTDELYSRFTNKDKLAYVQGALNGSAVLKRYNPEGKIEIYWANSGDLHDLFLKCLNDLVLEHGICESTVKVVSSKTYTVPICNSVAVYADETFLNLISKKIDFKVNSLN
tara:strand:+ start:53275 stop:53781 length:507 start_codon:yes stop_codon:yes gene_type:complete